MPRQSLPADLALHHSSPNFVPSSKTPNTHVSSLYLLSFHDHHQSPSLSSPSPLSVLSFPPVHKNKFEPTVSIDGPSRDPTSSQGRKGAVLVLMDAMVWAVALGLVLVLVWAWRAAESLWWRPRRVERALREEGLKGTPYRLLFGDLQEERRLRSEAWSKPMPVVSHRIAPRVAPFLHRAMEKHGKMSFSWFGPYPRLSIVDPELIREVLSNKSGHFGKPDTNPLGKFLATGLASYQGEKWAKHRRIINPAFHLEKLKRMLPAFSICCDELITRWEKLISSEESCELDVQPEFRSFTADVISRAAFGSSYLEGRRIFQLQAEQAQLLIEAVQQLYIPGFRYLPTGKNYRRKAIFKEVRELLKSMIEQRERAIKDGENSKDDLLGLLIESNAKHAQEHGDSKSLGMTTDEVIEECKLFYFAGHETTSVLLTWTVLLLSMCPSWQERAREEVLQVFGKTKPDFDGLSQLKVVTMILYEVLRLYPPGIILSRVTWKEMKLGNITLPPGVQLLLPVLFTHQDPDLWGEDASEFRPERFAEGVSKASKNQGAFFPFGWGPRICIGQSFAMVEAKMALARILQRFSFELSPSYAHAPHTVVTLQPQYGAQIILHNY